MRLTPELGQCVAKGEGSIVRKTVTQVSAAQPLCTTSFHLLTPIIFQMSAKGYYDQQQQQYYPPQGAPPGQGVGAPIDIGCTDVN